MTTLEKEPVSLDDALDASIAAEGAAEPEKGAEELVSEPLETTGEAIPETPEEIIEALEAPQMWDKNLRDSFNSWGALDEGGQPLIPNGREWQKGFGELFGQQQARTTQIEQQAARSQKQFEQVQGFQNEMAQVISPHQQMIVESGDTPARFISKSLGFTQAFDRDPVGTAYRALQSSGLLPEMQERLNGQEYVSPESHALTEFRKEYANDKKMALQRQEKDAQQVYRDAEAETKRIIQTFAEAKDASGNLLYPHVTDPRFMHQVAMPNGLVVDVNSFAEEMSSQIYGHRATYGTEMGLEEAYKIACQIHPDVAQTTKAKSAATDAARKNADALKATDASRKVDAGTTGKEKPSLDLDQHLDAAIAAHT